MIVVEAIWAHAPCEISYHFQLKFLNSAHKRICPLSCPTYEDTKHFFLSNCCLYYPLDARNHPGQQKKIRANLFLKNIDQWRHRWRTGHRVLICSWLKSGFACVLTDICAQILLYKSVKEPKNASSNATRCLLSKSNKWPHLWKRFFKTNSFVQNSCKHDKR